MDYVSQRSMYIYKEALKTTLCRRKDGGVRRVLDNIFGSKDDVLTLIRAQKREEASCFHLKYHIHSMSDFRNVLSQL